MHQQKSVDMAIAGKISPRHVAAVIYAMNFRLQRAGYIDAGKLAVYQLESVDHAIRAQFTTGIGGRGIRADDFAQIINPSRCRGR